MSEPIQTSYKFVAVLNKKIPIGKLMNALGHMTAGLVAKYPNLSEMQFASYFDKDGGEHPSMSDNPFIILEADNSNKLRTLRADLLVAGIEFTDFTNTMTTGTYVEQRERTQNTPEIELEYYGICMFGKRDELANLTKKFSLLK